MSATAELVARVVAYVENAPHSKNCATWLPFIPQRGFFTRVCDCNRGVAIEEARRLAELVRVAGVDGVRYRRIRAARKFVGMVEFATAHIDSDADYDAAIDLLPEVKP